jgi:DNA-binding MarR family transcriptional regulator
LSIGQINWLISKKEINKVAKVKDPKGYAIMLLHKTLDSLSKYEDETFAKLKTKITPQKFGILSSITYIREPVTPTDVANWVDRHTTSITLIVDRLEKDGIISRVRDLKDRRTLRLIITPEGRAVYKKASRVSKAVAKEVLACLSPDELNTLIDLISKVSAFIYQRRNAKDEIINARSLLKNGKLDF